ICISSDLLDESVGSFIPRVILICSVFVGVPVAPEVARLQLPHLPGTMVSPCLCSDDLESDTEMRKRHVSPTPHDAMHARWRSIVVSRSSSPTTSTSEIPTAPSLTEPSVVVVPSTNIISPVDAPPGIHQR
nr:hypothetical protein [Tanacetum cinerariifolium]